MAKLFFPAGERPTIRLQNCSEDLQITGSDATTIDVQSSAHEAELQSAVHAGDGKLVIEGLDNSVTLGVPRDAAVVVGRQGGTISIANVASVQLVRAEDDVRLRAIEGSVEIDGVEGDCVVERAGQVRVSGSIEGDVRISSAAAAKLDRVEGDVRINDVADVQLDYVEGDAEINGAGERCTIDHVDGDLRVRDCGPTTIGYADGDVSIARARGVQIEKIGGDCSLVLDEGSASISFAGGDLSARLKTGGLRADDVQGDASVEGGYGNIELPGVQGDLQLRLAATEAEYHVHVEGDATVALPENCDLRVAAHARGGISGLHLASGRKRSDTISAVVGGGRGALNIEVENELSIRGPGASRLAAAIRGAQASRPPLVIGSGASKRDTPATGATTRLRAEDAAVAVEPAPDDERMAILRMLSEGKLEVDEAERLLNAVDSRRPSWNPQMPAPRAPARVPREGDVFASLSADDLIELRQHGVDRQYIQQLRQAGYADLSVSQLVELRQHGVSQDYVASCKRAT